jgi:predicted metal-binding protein
MELYFKLLQINEVLNYYNADVIHINCRRCENFGNNWSCPPHDFDEKQYLSTYEFHYMVVLKINKSHSITQDYHYYRKIIGKRLLSIEKKFLSAEALYAGNCFQCEICTRVDHFPCVKKELLRYSYEAMGIELLTLIEEQLNLKKNEGLKIISGIMFNGQQQLISIKNELKGLKNELLSL